MNAEKICRIALESIAKNTCCSPCQEAAAVAKTALEAADVAKYVETRQRERLQRRLDAVVDESRYQ